MTKLLIIGAGSIGTRHANNAKTIGVAHLGVVDPDAERRAQHATDMGARPFETVEAALDWQPDAAVICTPPSSHLEIAMACVAAGCNLLIEKPLAAEETGIGALQAAIAQRSLTAMVAYQLRCHPAVLRMRELITTGTIGRLIGIQAEYGQYLPAWRPSRDYRETYTARAELGGGILLDGSHEIDYVRWLAGDVNAVYARAAKLSDLEIDVEDTAALVLDFAAGAIGELHLDFVQHGYSRRCTLIGSEATVRWDAASGLQIAGRGGAVHNEAIAPAPNEPYLAEMRAFVAGDAAALASLDDGRRVVQIVAAARRSAASRREVAL